jgi:predicted ATPase/DNA-binding CsgD family transcriptional regulator
MRVEEVSHKHNLPASVSSFIGREHELDAIRQRFGQYRLITLTGTGGVGKTRFALEAASGEVERFADGVWLVELAGLATPGLVAQTIARVFALPEVADLAPSEQLGAFLRAKHMLLVLDNCEHVIEEVAQLAAFLLARCQQLTLMATSREPLAISGETVLPIPPLSLPDPAQTGDWARLLLYNAPRLFVERAQAAESSFQLTAHNAAAVGELCRRLDGIPLALELAAGQLRGLSVAALAARLQQRFQGVIRGNRGALPRHQTLHAVVDWSYRLLSTPEQRVFRRLGVFAGGFVPEAAEWVCAEAALPTAEAVFQHLLHLAHKSLLQYNAQTERYRLLETIRFFCLERLAEAGEAELISARHLAWYLQFAEDAARHFAGPQQALWATRLEAEHDNLRVALAWAIDTNQIEQAARIARALWPFWHTHSYEREGLHWLERILTLETIQPLPPKIRSQLFNALGVLSTSMCSFDKATAYHAEALRLWRAAGDEAGVAQALHDIGLQQFEEMRTHEARRYAEESLTIARALNDQLAIARAQSLWALATIESDKEHQTPAARRAELAAAIAALEESLAIYQALDDSGSIAKILIFLARVEGMRGNYERTKPLVRESVRLLVALGNYLDLHGSLIVLHIMAIASSQQPEGSYLSAQVCGMIVARQEKLAGTSPWDEGPLQQAITQLTTILGADTFAQAFEHGRRMNPADLVALTEQIIALDFPASPPEFASRALPHADLTARELEVLRLVASGLTNAQVAQQLHVTPRTVNAHLTAIYSKLGVASRGAAMRYALDHQLG